ncbi:hypothetical protein CEP53_012734 [Fusarium sp. AF-6]|nr:hypothetical protein CEP53_012734 [Fusarium sp. AF-6]
MVEVAIKSPTTLPDGGQDDGHDKEANLNHNGFDTDDTVDSKAQAAIVTAYISIWVIYLIDLIQRSNSGALIMMTGCNGVKTPHIFIAHTSALKSRGLMIAYAPSPYTITTWITSYVTTAFLKGPGFRWGYGVFCIITAAFMLPLFGLFMYYYCKAKRMELVPKRESNREWREPIYHYARVFDAVGLLLITADISLVLLPFSIYSYQKGQCKAHIILYSFTFGGLLIIAFAPIGKSNAQIPNYQTDVGYLVMCQVFIARASNTLVIYEQTASMASAEHQFVVVVLAIQYMFSSIGGGISLSIAAAIWQGLFSNELSKRLPESAQVNLTIIYESLPQQLSYPWGSLERIAIQ